MSDYTNITKIVTRENVPWLLNDALVKEIDKLWEQRENLRKELQNEIFWHDHHKTEIAKLEDEIAGLQSREVKRQAAMRTFAEEFEKNMAAFLKAYDV